MVLIVTLIVMFLCIAGLSKAVMDTLQFHYGRSIFADCGTWWNPKESWKNKYKHNNPSLGPKFPGSTTIFVWVTDAWHFFQMIFLSSIQISIILPFTLLFSLPIFWWILIFFGIKLIFGAVFELFYKKILK